MKNLTVAITLGILPIKFCINWVYS